MIIYFDFDLSKIKLLQQQNNKKYFVVDFLNEYSQKKDFESIINFICAQNEELNGILRREKNYVILPNELVGVSNLTVPYSRSKVNKYFKTKFDLLYNKDEKMIVCEKLFSTDKNTSTYTFAAIREKYTDQIVNTFAKFGVKVSGMTYLSEVFSDFTLAKNKNLAKENFVIAYFGDYANFVAVSKSEVVFHQKLKMNVNGLAKKFVSYIKTNYKNMSGNEEEFEEKISKLSKKATKKSINFEKVQIFFDQFIKNLKSSALEFKCEKMILIDNSEKKLQDFNFDGDINYFAKIENTTLFQYATKNYFLEVKKGLF